jgi:menaquinone-9 beta-reductase
LALAARRYHHNVKGLSDRIELHYVWAVTPGYFWSFPVDDDLVNVGLGMLASVMKKERVNLTEALDATLGDGFFAPRFAKSKPVEKPIGWHLPVGSIHRHGPGFLLVGDAAA